MRTFEKAELCHPLLFKKPIGHLSTDWSVFDDHVEINENVIVLDRDSFTLKVTPVGIVSILTGDEHVTPIIDREIPVKHCKERPIHITLKIDRVEARRRNLGNRKLFR